MLSNIFLCQHYFGEQGDNKCQPMRIIYTLTLVTYLESVKFFFSSEHSNGMLGDFYHAGNPSDVE